MNSRPERQTVPFMQDREGQDHQLVAIQLVQCKGMPPPRHGGESTGPHRVHKEFEILKQSRRPICVPRKSVLRKL